MTSIKVLTIRQPYAELIKEDIKKYEIRSRKTNYRGKLYIHSGMAKIKKESKKNIFLKLLKNKELKYGHIIATCTLANCVYIDEEFLKEMNINAPNDLYPKECIGYYAWILTNITPLVDTIPAKGQLGIWNYHL